MSDEQNPEYPTENVNDASYRLARGLIGSVPVLSGLATELFGALVTPSVERRREAWFAGVLVRLQRLEQERDNFRYAKAFEDESFITTFLLACRHAQMNHDQENLTALRNAVLNSALQESSDEIRQKMFITWAGELTAWHIRILRVFQLESASVPVLHLDRPGWLGNTSLPKLVLLIESQLKVKGSYDLCVQIVSELYTKGLITNSIPNRGGTMTIKHSPVVSPTAEKFLEFITSPLSDDDNAAET